MAGIEASRFLDDFREAFDPSELVKLLSVRLGARFQSGTWNAIKELASHCE